MGFGKRNEPACGALLLRRILVPTPVELVRRQLAVMIGVGSIERIAIERLDLILSQKPLRPVSNRLNTVSADSSLLGVSGPPVAGDATTMPLLFFAGGWPPDAESCAGVVALSKAQHASGEDHAWN